MRLLYYSASTASCKPNIGPVLGKALLKIPFVRQEMEAAVQEFRAVLPHLYDEQTTAKLLSQIGSTEEITAHCMEELLCK